MSQPEIVWELPGNEDDVEYIIEQRGTVRATRVFVCVTTKNSSFVDFPFGRALAVATGHHFVVVEFEKEVVKGSGLCFIRIDRFQHVVDGQPTGKALTRAKCIPSMDAIQVYDDHDFKLQQDRPAMLGHILAYCLQLHNKYPTFDERASPYYSRGNAMNCQGFAKLLVEKIRKHHASLLRRMFAEVESVSFLASTVSQFRTPTHTSGVPNAASHGEAPAMVHRPKLL